MSYTNIIPATDWFYVHEQLGHQAPKVIYPLAVFALENGEAVGLIAVTPPGFKEKPRLVAPPAGLQGAYVHRTQLTDEEQALLRTTR